MGILAKIRESNSPKPVGWKTAIELAKEEKTSLTQARRLLELGVSSKLVERKKFRVVDSKDGVVKTMWHFREVPEKREGSNFPKTDNGIERKKK
jgi:hypothetical protein